VLHDTNPPVSTHNQATTAKSSLRAFIESSSPESKQNKTHPHPGSTKQPRAHTRRRQKNKKAKTRLLHASNQADLYDRRRQRQNRGEQD
jgi:hypothetical protein